MAQGKVMKARGPSKPMWEHIHAADHGHGDDEHRIHIDKGALEQMAQGIPSPPPGHAERAQRRPP